MTKFTNCRVLILFTILTIIFTYPVLFSVISGDKVPGGGDVYWFLWDLWHYKKAVTNFDTPYYTNDIFYPMGVNLAFSTITPFNSLISIPLQPLFGLVRTYNILWILSFIISGYGTFLLVRYLTDNSEAAFISGLIFMFSPYHFAHALGHLNLTTIQWIPFYVLYLFKTANEDKIKNSVYAGIFLFLITISEYYYLVYMSFFTLIFFLYCLSVDKRILLKKNTLKRFLIMVVTFILIAFHFIYPLLKELSVSKSDYMYVGGFETYSADILGFFTPTIFHPILAKYTSQINNNFTGNGAEYTVFIGYTVLFLTLFAIIKTKERFFVKFWILSTIIFFIFTLGPTLHINGKLINGIPLPYSLLMKIPIISIARVPSRWDVLVMLSVAVLAGYGLNEILKNKNKFANKISRKHVLTTIFSSLILFEFLAIPYPMGDTKIPGFYHQLKNDSGDFAIVEIPFEQNARYMYYQTLHGKKLVNGYASRASPETGTFLYSTPVLNQLQYPKKPILSDILNQNNSDIGQSVLNYYNIRYAIIHNSYMKKDDLNFSKELLQGTLDIQPKIYKEDGITTYEINRSHTKPFMMIGTGWYGVQNWENGPGRWINNKSTIKIMSSKDTYITLSFDVGSFYKERDLRIYINEKLIGKYTVELQGDTLEKIAIQIPLNKGENIVSFDTSKGTSPSSIGISKDERELSLGFQNVTLID